MNFGNNSNLVNYPSYPKSFVNANVPKHIKFIQNNNRIVINSEDRDRSIYENPCTYKIKLPCDFRNVSLFEIGLIMIPNFSNSEKYFIIKIDEIDGGLYTSLNKDISNAIAVVPNELAINNYNLICQKPGDTSFLKNYIKKFVDCPLARLSTLTIKILKPNGDLINFGNDLININKKYYFSSNTNKDNTHNNWQLLNLKIINNNHDLQKIDDLNCDTIQVFNSKIKYKKNGKEYEKVFNILNNTYKYEDKCKSENNDNKTLILETSNIQIKTDENSKIIKIQNILEDEDITDINFTGYWERVNNIDGFSSKIKIEDISDIDNNNIKLKVTKNHNLNKYDRIWINNTKNDSNSFSQNWHIIINIETIDTDIDYQNISINKNNITQDDINDVTMNPASENQAWLNNDYGEINTTYGEGQDTTTINNNNLSISNQGNNYFWLARYGKPDPSIQNMFIFNIGTREEDNDNVMSENISYGNTRF